jgi:hypothetical protein
MSSARLSYFESVVVSKYSGGSSHLGTSVGCAQEIANSGTSNGSCSTCVTTLNARDCSNRNLLLAEASLDVGDHKGDEKSLGNHICGCVVEKCLLDVKR